MKVTNRILALGILAGAANGVTAQTLGPITTSTPIPSTLTDWSGSLVFPEFNPSLGTLESVTLDLSSSASTSWSVVNTPGAGTASHLSAYTGIYLSVEDAGNNFAINDPELTLNTPVFKPSSLAPGASCFSGLETMSGASENTYSDASILSEFTGRGHISLDASTFTQTFESSHGGNVGWSQTTDASLTGTITYDYAPRAQVPDGTPTVGLLALACGAAPFFRRQRK